MQMQEDKGGKEREGEREKEERLEGMKRKGAANKKALACINILKEKRNQTFGSKPLPDLWVGFKLGA